MVQGIDLPSIFLAAQQAKMNRMKIADAERQAQMQQALPQARADYFAGRPGELQRLSPEEFMKLEGSRAGTQKTEAEARANLAKANKEVATANVERGLRTSQVLVNAIDYLKQNPAAYPQVMQQLQGMAQGGAIDLDPSALPQDMPPPEALEQMRSQMMMQLQSLSDPKITDTMANTASQFGLNLKDPQAYQDPRFQQAMGAQKQQDTAKVSMDLRKQWESQPEFKVWSEINLATRKLKSAAQDPSSASDIAVMYGYLKAMNPTSTVREGSLATVEDTRGLSEEIRSMYNRVVNGAQLGEAQKREFIRAGLRALQDIHPDVQKRAGYYRWIAQEQGINPDHVVQPIAYDPSEIEAASSGAGVRRQPSGPPTPADVQTLPGQQLLRGAAQRREPPPQAVPQPGAGAPAQPVPVGRNERVQSMVAEGLASGKPPLRIVSEIHAAVKLKPKEREALLQRLRTEAAKGQVRAKATSVVGGLGQ